MTGQEMTATERVVYHTHSSQVRESMSGHGGATKRITKGGAAKLVGEREEPCVQAFILVFAGSTGKEK